MLKILVAFMICSTGYTQELQKEDFDAGAQFGYKEFEMRSEHRNRRNRVSESQVNEYTSEYISEPNSLPTAQLLDLTTARIVQRTVAALNRFGYEQDAAKVAGEYELNYKSFYVDRHLGIKEIGQHDPMNIWMELVHVMAHIKLGDFWCQYFHVHDLFIINFATPVVLFKTPAFDKVDYIDHFAGHPLSKWSWDHHGLAGVISYWTATAVCGAATSGLGIITFVCGPVAGFVENGMDRYIAPKIGSRVWDSAQRN